MIFDLFWGAAVFSLANAAFAQQEVPRCYVLPRPSIAAEFAEEASEVWCYQRMARPEGGLYIYNADNGQVRPELALLVSGEGMITHGSLSADQLGVYRVRASDFNPFSIPLEEPVDARQVVPRFEGSSVWQVQRLLESAEEPVPLEDIEVKAGNFQGLAAEASLPWRGYWWPEKGAPLANGANSPLRKYDRLVQGRTGVSSTAASWERSRHASSGESWYGHCNGWAASSILRGEPRMSRRDPQTGVFFDVISQKGILAEKDYCAAVSFYGHRYNGRSSDELRDIYPQDFHKVLSYYLGRLHKPIAFDYHRDSSVDTHVISGYWMKVVQTSPQTFRVNIQLRVHRYDSFRTNTPGIAPSYRRSYSYVLKKDEAGKLVGGYWLSTNPDFLWVPLGSRNCQDSGNPRLQEDWVRVILNLPRAG
jgi:hypothetical protein